jgi:hypothetical protein
MRPGSFAWNFRHAGRDGRLDTADDVVTNGQLHVPPVGKVVKFELISAGCAAQPVDPQPAAQAGCRPRPCHPRWFDANKTGEFGIGCAELCGSGHGVMAATLVVELARAVPEVSEQVVHHARHPPPGFIGRYIFSLDHKTIGRQYLFTGLIMAAVGGYLAYVIRHQLAFPDAAIPARAGSVRRCTTPIVTMHGTIHGVLGGHADPDRRVRQLPHPVDDRRG